MAGDFRTIGLENNIHAYVREVAAATGSDPERAHAIATAALREGLQHPAFHGARALWFQRQNRHAEALAELEQAFALTPRDANLLNAIGLNLLRLNRPTQAIAAFASAIHIEPAQAQYHYLKGCSHAAAGEPGAASRCYERAVALQPNHVDALTAVAVAAARSGETKKAKTFGERALKLAPENPTAAIALAMADLHERNFDRAERRLATLLAKVPTQNQTPPLALGLIGDALDGLERTAEAFEAFKAKNEILRNLHESRYMGAARALNRIERLIADFNEVAPRRWERTRIADAESSSRRHVFLLGFMRSGTTLIEQVLAAHPDVEDLEERETLKELSAAYLSSANGLKELSGLSGQLLDRARENYWQRVRGFGAKPDGKVFVEKQPFNTLNLPLIARLFPDAKVLFAMRDPRDVVLSCFRRHLEVNPMTFELLTLADAARFYDRVMTLAVTYREKLPLNLLELRYEELVTDFDGCLHSVCAFIGLTMDHSLRDFARTARVVRSPSGAQVRRGLYSDAMGQWRRYEKELSPIIPMLRPWIERFGYPLH